ncbi:MAG: DUF4363 family protein [Clostridia bacterium]|nr:DUF4363 family protein [Clostridia bacterium]
MKTFICALIIAAAIITFVLVNSSVLTEKLDCIYQYVRSAADEIRAGAGVTGIREKLDDIYDMWDDTVGLLSFTTGYADIDRADDAINDAHTCTFTGDADECLGALNRASDAVSRLINLASFSFDSIF